ncbi:hypothetical protein EK21DRAFT_101426 [Setomelanomma holmii]|uniref:C2H2-type domain-containing protein n=1 Tax=Setomelanomma holmii TaxID=210430 RepID=A0A9P4H6I3_9PLEO|nr:hypothetical protein EK21DRAFT_101426 [Setomelanomma holmii]
MSFWCGICSDSFTSKASLNHHTANHNDATTPQLSCAVCGRPFDDSLALESHKISSGHTAEQYTCNDCGQAFTTTRGLKDHRMKRPGCRKAFADVSPAPQARPEAPVHCDRCSITFRTRREFKDHRSYKRGGPCADHKHKAPSKHRGGYVDPDAVQTTVSDTLGYDEWADEDDEDEESDAPSDLSVGKVWCGKCKTSFESMAKYNAHALRCVTQPRSVESASVKAASQVSKAIQPRLSTGKQIVPAKLPEAIQPPLQAQYITGKMLRLLIQSDILIHHDGKMNVSGIDWTRIGFSKQSDVVAMFDGMCHLPKAFQGEYLPAPKALSDEHADLEHVWDTTEFQPSPDRDRPKPGLGVVALACSKVLLPNCLQEVVKIAAVDLVTCRILMTHLVCTDPNMKVADWRSTETGLFSWKDMEQTRLNGFKVLKGWAAARAALWKFVDKETIIVGHNLRSDLDSLRMIHGRGVDIAKVAEKAAKGPLSKVQVGLDSLCRDYSKVMLKSDPEYGRDALMDAFALRETGLWIIKNKEKFEKEIRQKSIDYQRIMPRAAAAA